MALSESAIIFNFNQAKGQADKLDEIADNLDRLSGNDFAGIMQNVSANWKGENASAYLSKGAKLQGNMSNTAESLRAVAGEIRAAAQRMYNAEMAALALINTKNT